MASWFKKHFSCIRREPSVIVTDEKQLKNEMNTAAKEQQNTKVKTIIVKNDLKRNSLTKKSNEYRDYSKNAEAEFIAENYFKSRNNSMRGSNNAIASQIKTIQSDIITNNKPNNINNNNANSNNVVINRPKQIPRVIREANNNTNNLTLERLMKRLRSCNECLSQKRICKCFIFLLLTKKMKVKII